MPGPREILLRVHATTVNRTDLGFLRADPALVRAFGGLRRPRHQVLGNDFSGVVEAVGAEVTRVQVGQALFGCTESFGAQAEYMLLPEQGAFAPLPTGWSHTEAAMLPDGGHLALNYLRAAEVGRGTELLINGTTGAIGSAAVQLAKVLGARVTAVCDTERLPLVKALGADRCVDYRQVDFTQLRESFDVVFDAVGMSTFFACRRLLREQGVYLSTELGPWGQNPLLALATWPSRGRQVRFPITWPATEDLDFLRHQAELGLFRPVVDRVISWADVPEGYRYVALGHKTGNVGVQVVADAGARQQLEQRSKAPQALAAPGA